MMPDESRQEMATAAIPPREDSRDTHAATPASWCASVRTFKPPDINLRWMSPVKPWFRLFRLDLLGMVVFALFCAILAACRPFRIDTTMWPMWRDPVSLNWRGPLDISYPIEKSVLNTFNCGLVVVLVPIAIVLFMQMYVKSFWDANAAILGLLKALTAM